MSIPPALLKPQLMTRDASESVQPQTHAAPKSPEPTPRPSFHLQLLCTLCGSLLVFLVFGEDEANRINRLDIRYDFDDRLGAMVLTRPLPFDRPHLDVPISAQVAVDPMSKFPRHE